MFLSLLEVEPRSAVARSWLGNPYRVHQRLRMAYPDSSAGRILFRIEDEWQRPRILVQAEGRAEWPAAFDEFAVLAAPAVQKKVEVRLTADDVLRFRLLANPTKRLSAGCPGKKADGARVGLFNEGDQLAWLERKAAASGFELLGADGQPRGTVVSRKNPAKEPRRQSHLAVQFDGRLRIIDPVAVQEAVRLGIGSAKAYGFGLLSLAR
jgi:CRISPR system Cascade subunit CasE